MSNTGNGVRSRQEQISDLPGFVLAVKEEYCSLPGNRKGLFELLGNRINEVKVGEVVEEEYIRRWCPDRPTELAFERFFKEVLALVFYNLAISEAVGASLRQAVTNLEAAIHDKYGLDHGAIISLISWETLRRTGANPNEEQEQ